MNPFEVLGLPADPGLGDEQVRAAWRAIAAATHPDRGDGGDLARYTAASAAYAELRTAWARSEAYADIAERVGRADGPITAPIPVVLGAVLLPAAPPWQPFLTRLNSRPGSSAAARCTCCCARSSLRCWRWSSCS